MPSEKLQASLLRLANRTDIALALLLVGIIFMMVLPLPTLLIDILIAINLCGAVVLMMVSIYIRTPTAFSSFPSVLLLSTLFRLALSISTTRLILLQADAGAIIYTFGDFVVGGNMVVGLVVFLIITLVQFIVITKGSERVAEVGARFSLDGMPGKQMSIDSDLRSGVITMAQARRMRAELQKESQMYGAMDGAMKFVKGDAIAGLLIIIVNILGGVSVGVFQNGMSAGEALQLYALLTVGDGLIAQIPALFISITSGIIVTRVASEDAENLGADIGRQIIVQPRAMLIGAVLMFGFAAIPGFPAPVFIVLGLGIGAVGYALYSQEKEGDGQYLDTYPALAPAGNTGVQIQLPDADNELAPNIPIVLELPEALKTTLPPELLNHEFARVRHRLLEDLGIPFPGVH
ncbi:MAG TPA: EscV/YscV/HrcV family type III secretion system export apparatus protein, partial [Gammaproteobacteria bacterium]|nr:EscV/YscV/HrcV family type III secretion system export apparatus protein [Gammaproteobacteria bacterium]